MKEHSTRRIDLQEEINKQRDNQELSVIAIQSIKQISRANYECYGDYIETEIEINGERYSVIATNFLSFQVLRDKAQWCRTNEESLRHFCRVTPTKEAPLTDILKEYKKNSLISGTMLRDEEWFKFYGVEEPQDPLRNEYFVEWINYEEQLKNGNTIFDDRDLYGIFAMTYEGLYRSSLETLKYRYGNHVFIVKPLEQYNYFTDGIEIVGPRFEVLKKLDISKDEDMSELNKHIYQAFTREKEKLQIKLEEEKATNETIAYKLNKLNLTVSKIKKYNIINFLLGIIFGIIITYLFLS